MAAPYSHDDHAASNSSTSYFTYPVRYAVSGVLRRLSTDPQTSTSASSAPTSPYLPARPRTPPYNPPPLAPLSLHGQRSSSSSSATSSQILSRLVAEEIRLLVPPRLQLVDTWRLVFSLEQHGASLGTLYRRCAELAARRAGFILVVQDSAGGIFGAYLNDAPRPSHGHYYGTGECFLWRASVLASTLTLASLLPPPPSADTTHATRMTTLGSPKRRQQQDHRLLAAPSSEAAGAPGFPTKPPRLIHARLEHSPAPSSGTTTPERIRFKAFPYSGVNDYMIFCEQGFLSVGGGDGKYGLWMDASLEKGLSGSCPTFGNEPLSDEGAKFDVLGVELWHLST